MVLSVGKGREGKADGREVGRGTPEHYQWLKYGRRMMASFRGNEEGERTGSSREEKRPL